MKERLLSIALAALTVGLLGSCSKINERIDGLENRIGRIESDRIASIDNQIAAINTSISDLGNIRTSIQDLLSKSIFQGSDIEVLKVADKSLGLRIDELKDYTDETLRNYAKSQWVEATFATLKQHEWTCDTVAKIDARIGALDAKLSEAIKDSEESLKSWVNAQMGSYYTAAQMDAKIDELLSQIASAGEESEAKVDSLATELKTTKTDIETAKSELTEAYKSAIEEAIKKSEGTLSSKISSAVSSVNSRVSSLSCRVSTLESKVNALSDKVTALEEMIQSVTIIPDYNDGSIEATNGILTVNCVITPKKAVYSLDEGNFTILTNVAITKGAMYGTLDITAVTIDRTDGTAKIKVDVSSALPAGSGKTLTVAVNVKNGISDFTTEFVAVTPNMTTEDDGNQIKITLTPSDPDSPKAAEGTIPTSEGFSETKQTVIEISGIGKITFDNDATAKILENAEEAHATNVFFKVEDVTSTKPVQGADIVYEVTMKTVDENGTEVYSADKAAGVVTIEIPLAEDVVYVNSVTLVNEAGEVQTGGVVDGSVDFDEINHTLTFKVNHFSKYAVDYVKSSEFEHVTKVSLDKTELTLPVGDQVQLTATVLPENATNKEVTWTSSAPTVATVDETTGKVTAVAAGTATITAKATDGSNQQATCAVTVTEALSYVEIEAKYNGNDVSTLRWYRQNLATTTSGSKTWKGQNTSAVKVPGTDKDVIVGDYFQWGTFTGFYGNGAGTDKGLLPYTSFTSTGCGDGSNAFTFESGKQFNEANAPYYSGSAYTKYNATDGKTTLEASDDVASIILGGTWRMPTKDEIKAMKEATYWAWDATDKGYYVYAPNPATDAGKVNNGTGTYNKADALLFFPATGYGDATSMSNAGTYGYYRLSTLCSENTGCAYRQFFSDTNVYTDNYTHRRCGFSVRPVQDPAATYVAVTSVSLNETSKNITVGGNLQLKATVIQDDATQQGVYWTSDKPAVATVDPYGKVTAVAAGTATITVTTTDGGKTATCAVTVTAPEPGPELPAGALKGEFSVSATKKVHFSQGNLTCDISGATPDWKFYEHQYDCATAYDANLISLFTWGYDAANSIDPDGIAYAEGHITESEKNLSKSDDWGNVFGGESSIWRTLTTAEWQYLFSYDGSGSGGTNYSNDTRQGLYAYGVTVAGKTNCVVLYPDGFTGTKVTDATKTTAYDTAEEWTAAQNAGAVCLPAAGKRNGSDVFTVGDDGRYWSSTAFDSNRAYYVDFDSSVVYLDSYVFRHLGFSVRLVTEVPAAGDPGNGTEQYKNNSNPDWFSK